MLVRIGPNQGPNVNNVCHGVSRRPAMTVGRREVRRGVSEALLRIAGTKIGTPFDFERSIERFLPILLSNFGLGHAFDLDRSKALKAENGRISPQQFFSYIFFVFNDADLILVPTCKTHRNIHLDLERSMS